MPDHIQLIIVTPDESAWKEAAKRWHREFLKMPVLATKDTTKFMTGLPGCRTNQYLGTVESEAQFYPYIANKRGDSSTAINFEELEIYFGSMIHDFVPNDYVQTLLGEHAEVLGMGQAKSEMAKLILTTIMQSAGEKLALAIPLAVRDQNGNTTMDLFNGLITVIEAAVTAGKVSGANKNYDEIPVITVENVVDVIKSIEYGLDSRLRRQQRFLYCDPAIVDMYNEGYLLTHPAVPYNEKFEQNYVEGSNRRMTFAPLDGLAGTGIMFVAPKMNVIYGYDGVSDEERFEVLRFKPDTMTVNAKIFFGVGFRTFDYRFLKVLRPIEQVATPTFSPAAWGTDATQTVKIECATPVATIYYTDDGNAPTTSSTKYTGEITLSGTKTIKAIAVKEGITNSEVGTKTYTKPG
jgi:hypothetical protein